MEEKPTRGHRRYRLALPIWVRFRKAIQEKVGTERKDSKAIVEEEEQTITTDIGSGGCFFYSKKKPRVGTPATMVVDVPTGAAKTGSGKVLCRGKVVRVSEKAPGKVGVACRIDSYSFQSPDVKPA